MLTYLHNAWYAAAFADEVAEKPLGRKLLDRDVALFRDADGTVHALEDRCPQRVSSS